MIRRLQIGVYGLEPLPARLPSEDEADAVMTVIEEQKRLKRSWAEIADHLHAAGYRPQRGERFNRALVYSLDRRARARSIAGLTQNVTKNFSRGVLKRYDRNRLG